MIFFTPYEFFTPANSGCFFFVWSLNDIKSLQISRILLSILVDLSNDVVGWVLVLLISSSSVSLMFFRLFSFLAGSKYFSICSLSFILKSALNGCFSLKLIDRKSPKIQRPLLSILDILTVHWPVPSSLFQALI